MFGLIAAILVFGVLLIFLFIFTRYFGLWIQSQLTRANITFFNLLGMTFPKGQHSGDCAQQDHGDAGWIG